MSSNGSPVHVVLLVLLFSLILSDCAHYKSESLKRESPKNENLKNENPKSESRRFCPVPDLEASVCSPGAGPFSPVVDNEFFPLKVGSQMVFKGEDKGRVLRIEMRVLDDNEVVAGIVTRVVEEWGYSNSELIMIARKFYAQALDGTVCYFGKDVDVIEDEFVVSHQGSWRAGVGDEMPRIAMPAKPYSGAVFRPADNPNGTEGITHVVSIGEAITVPAGSFEDTIKKSDCDSLSGAVGSTRLYVRGIGLAIDEDAELISY